MAKYMLYYNGEIVTINALFYGGNFMEENYSEYRRKIYYYETDKMGIVHHSNYIRLFEEARLDMMNKIGINYKDLEDIGIIIPVVSVSCKYLIPLYFDDYVSVYSKVIKFNGIKMEVSYKICKEGNESICTTGHSEHCFLDSKMKPFRMKKLYPDLYKKIMDSV